LFSRLRRPSRWYPKPVFVWSRIIVDHDGAADIQPGHISEAIGMGFSCALRSATPLRV
jgi:hypothetical protein